MTWHLKNPVAPKAWGFGGKAPMWSASFNIDMHVDIDCWFGIWNLNWTLMLIYTCMFIALWVSKKIFPTSGGLIYIHVCRRICTCATARGWVGYCLLRISNPGWKKSICHMTSHIWIESENFWSGLEFLNIAHDITYRIVIWVFMNF